MEMYQKAGLFLLQYWKKVITLNDVSLSKNELESIKSALLNFVIRVSDSSNDRLPQEITTLTQITTLLLQAFSN